MCCQRKSQFMNSVGVTGSICLRNVATVRRWMRAKRRRSHHSVCAREIGELCSPGQPGAAVPPFKPSGRNWPRSIAPLASMRSRAFSISEAGSPSNSPISEAVVGPRWAIQPCTAVSTASSKFTVETRLAASPPVPPGLWLAAGDGASPVSTGWIARNNPSRSAATQYCLPAASATTARPSRCNRSKNPFQSALVGGC